jgi:uncharacterized tellurite resistance protein B-like protein
MFEALKSLLAGHAAAKPGAEGHPQAFQIAACALLLELAYADHEFTEEERRQIEEASMRHFDLDAEKARELMAEADQARRESIDLHHFTSVVVQHYDEGQRMVLAELMWRVIQADGRLADQETQLARKLASLLELRPGYLAEARRRVEQPGS